MELNSLFFRKPKPSYTSVSISLLPNSELLFVSKQTRLSDIVSCSCNTMDYKNIRKIPVLLSKCEQPTGSYLLYFHAMSEDIKDAYNLINPLQNKLGINVFFVEYPGYGIYTGLEASADMITEDAEEVYKYLTTKRRIQPSDIVLMGRSMGTGPACHLASMFNPKGLILISPYTSIRKVAEHFVGSLLSKIVNERFQNIEAMEKIVCPLLLIHGQKDEMIPKSHGIQLLQVSKSRIKQFHFPQNMTHNKFDYEEDFEKQITQFLNKIGFVQEKIVQIEPLKKMISLARQQTSINSHRMATVEVPSQKHISLYFSDPDNSLLTNNAKSNQYIIKNIKKNIKVNELNNSFKEQNSFYD